MEAYRANKSWKEPWLYRQEFFLDPDHRKHYLLETNGITSKADIFFNGWQIANKEFQSGSYGGHAYDITPMASDINALLIRVHPTDYNHDLAQGFNDWNPAPPDHGSGVWRDVNVKQTGPAALGPLSVTTEFKTSGTLARVSVRALARNLEKHTIEVLPMASVFRSGSESSTTEGISQVGTSSIHVDQERPSRNTTTGEKNGPSARETSSRTISLAPFASKELKIDLDIPFTEADIWWPRQWGAQPLFAAHLSVSVENITSDRRNSTFGFRKVTSRLNNYNDRVFEVNGFPFQVIGAGYAPDIFLRWDSSRFTSIAEYILDIGLNTIRLEGNMEHPELYDICDRLGIMILPGWECCDKWEAWSYTEEEGLSDSLWGPNDYITANASMRHEAEMMQTHPAVLGFLIGSDLWPNKRATSIYLDALYDCHWETPILAAASKRGHPRGLDPSGLKMEGPYSWVPPNYWYENRLGAAFGFGSELGSGVGTPELQSLSQFLDWPGINDLWRRPSKDLYHMSPADSFSSRKIYNKALWRRFGAPRGLSEYLLSAQMMDYEATRAQFEAYSSNWSAKRPATGLIYWLLNSAWPSLHWELFDYYLHPAGSYFGAKTGNRFEHVAYDYVHKEVSIINRSANKQGSRILELDVIDLHGNRVLKRTVQLFTTPNSSRRLFKIKELKHIRDMVLLRLVLKNGSDNKLLSRNVYYTPVEKYADYTALNGILPANVSISAAMDRTNMR
ncbi:exo-beta-D-glucosaminidase [Diaporthe amygdali]|uniref:exo-beta-D-glucosaminidase n=1 Tax=Phomopsis amygdali TaxID=1214568 RepID=UPI0022FF1505|nr:exo-beta-D-glucosaminidase [Diaporthe amygdali]KAJ0118683.1 exo-beta-D-glucosaminidase [Diaporthe amygdali]